MTRSWAIGLGILASITVKAAHQKPALMLNMKQRVRPIKDEQSQRIANLHKQARALDMKLATNIKSATDYTSPVTEAEAYYAYPLTLDYVIDVAFQNGTELVQYPVIVDTGSSNLAVAVSACTDCLTGSTNLKLGWYDPELCIDVTYGSGSWSGMMTDKIEVGFMNGDSVVTDEVYLAGITSADDFFCGGFYGILGLAYSGLSESYSSCQILAGQPDSGVGNNMDVRKASLTRQKADRSARSERTSSTNRERHANYIGRNGRESTNQFISIELSQGNSDSLSDMSSTPLLDSFYDDGVVSQNQISILFCGDDAIMGIGGIDDSQAKETISWVDTQKTYGEIYGYFLVEVFSISINNVTVTSDMATLNEIGGVLVDSGTTLIYLPSTVVPSIEKEVQTAVPTMSERFFEWATCVHESELSSFPDLALELDGYMLNLNPTQYLLWYGGCYYWGISSSSIAIIGNVALQDKLVVFDKTANKIGFAEGDCSAYGGDSYSDDSSSETVLLHTMKDFTTKAREYFSNLRAESSTKASSSTLSAHAWTFIASISGVVLLVLFVHSRALRNQQYEALPESIDEASI